MEMKLVVLEEGMQGVWDLLDMKDKTEALDMGQVLDIVKVLDMMAVNITVELGLAVVAVVVEVMVLIMFLAMVGMTLLEEVLHLIKPSCIFYHLILILGMMAWVGEVLSKVRLLPTSENHGNS